MRRKVVSEQFITNSNDMCERIEFDNRVEHRLYGQRHRVDGPAVEWANGDKKWYMKDKLHRVDGPAVEWASGDKKWYMNGKLHRVDGPAVEWANGDKEWWVNNQLHRLDGPAFEYSGGTKAWYLEGELHREDGPAFEQADGTKEWYLNGKRHRVDGPAVECADGTKEWWINDVRVDPPQILHPEQQRHTDKECLVYHEIPTPGQKYRMCSFSEEHVFTLEGLTGFQRDRCLYCQHPLIEEVYIQE
jgi:hypothetical protein